MEKQKLGNVNVAFAEIGFFICLSRFIFYAVSDSYVTYADKKKNLKSEPRR